jgi:hypothetical protein
MSRKRENDKDQERRTMNTDNTQGTTEPSLASAGSHGDGMAARLRSWRDERGYPTPGEMLDEAADEIERLRLTDEEREAISAMAVLLEKHGWREEAAVFGGLRDRLK